MSKEYEYPRCLVLLILCCQLKFGSAHQKTDSSLFNQTKTIIRHTTVFEPSVVDKCVRAPIHQTSVAKTPGSNGFKVEIMFKNGSSLNPTGYVPGETYIIKVEGLQTQYSKQTFRGVNLVAVAADRDHANEPIGKFMIGRNDPLRMSSMCPHAVIESSLYPQSEVKVKWMAPAFNRGCVEFKAMIMEYRDTWYMDDGPLTHRFCQMKKDRRHVGSEKMIPDDEADVCCACDEAKYEMVFDGLWSRQTHPRDFPHLVHLTHFSDIIGASHSPKFTMWNYDGYATDGMKELAEWGNAYKEEQELKLKAEEIRTIIKGRGLWYPNVQEISKAIFRVDKYHHLVSLASMFGPSPDWLVGISRVNLCLKDCSWVQERTFDLYPFDAGTDNGASYMAPNNPSLPREKITKITNEYPADSRNPFYEPGKKMTPMARLTLKRQKVYDMDCKEMHEYKTGREELGTSEDLEYKDRRECTVGEWSHFSLCSATCGKGIKMRSRTYRFPIKAQMFNCHRQMSEKVFCNASITVCEDSDAFNEDCMTENWSDWTECTVTCGTGFRSRTRNLRDQSNSHLCKVDLLEKEDCIGLGGEDCSVTPNPLCQMTFWSSWSPCSASCGKGHRARTRLFISHENVRHQCSQYKLMQDEQCETQECSTFFMAHKEEICREGKEDGSCRGTFPRFYYDRKRNMCQRFTYTGCKGNSNNFETIDQCKQACVKSYDPHTREIGKGKEYSLSLLTTKSKPKSGPRYSIYDRKPHSFGDAAAHRRRHQGRTEYYLENGEKENMVADKFPSNKMLNRIAVALNVHSIDPYINVMSGMVCVPANHLAVALGVGEDGTINDGGASVDCMMTEWSPWSHCSVTCGKGRVQRSRAIKVFPRNGGESCPATMIQRRRCTNRPCPMNIYQPMTSSFDAMQRSSPSAMNHALSHDCLVTRWSAWSACSVSCGSGGMQLRQRRRMNSRRRNSACSHKLLLERRPCKGAHCNI